MSEFVNKVYDRYLSEDWSFGQDNLNPVREMSFAEKDETIGQLMSSIKDKVTEIEAKYPDEVVAESYTFNTGEKFEGDPTCLINAKSKAGGEILVIPSFENEDDALVEEVKQLMVKLAGIAEENLDDLFADCNCNGSFDLISGDQIDTDDDKLDNELMDEFYDGNNNENSDGNNSEEDDGKVDVSNKDKDEAETQTQIAQNDLADDISDNVDAAEASVKECAKADLALLKVILSILKVISSIKKILNPSLNIAVEIVEIVTMVCSIRVNPPVIAEIIQKIINKLIAVLCMIISMILQMLWDLLGLDCITEESADILNQIKDALAGVSSIFAEIDATAVSFSNGIKETIDTVSLAQKAIVDAVKDLPSWKDIGNYFDVGGAISAVGDDWKKNYKSYAEAAHNSMVEQFNIKEKIGEAQAKIEEVGAQWNQVKLSAAKMTGANSGVQRLMHSFDGVKSL